MIAIPTVDARVKAAHRKRRGPGLPPQTADPLHKSWPRGASYSSRHTTERERSMRRYARLSPQETERVMLRPLDMQDLAIVSCLQRDPRMRRYLGNGNPLEPEESALWLAQRVCSWRDLGYGFAAVELRESSRFIGWFGLDQVSDHPELAGEIEIGGSIHPDLWGQGLAEEIATVTVAFAFEKMGLERIVARYRSDNAASARLVQKLGMTYNRTVTHLTLPRLSDQVWELHRRNFHPARPAQSSE